MTKRDKLYGGAGAGRQASRGGRQTARFVTAKKLSLKGQVASISALDVSVFNLSFSLSPPLCLSLSLPFVLMAHGEGL